MTIDEKITELLNQEHHSYDKEGNYNPMTPTERAGELLKQMAVWTYETLKPDWYEYVDSTEYAPDCLFARKVVEDKAKKAGII